MLDHFYQYEVIEMVSLFSSNYFYSIEILLSIIRSFIAVVIALANIDVLVVTLKLRDSLWNALLNTVLIPNERQIV